MSQRKPDNPPPSRVPSNNQIEEKASVDQVIRESIGDILPAVQLKQVLTRLTPRLQAVMAVSTKYHSGPLPSVETVQGYERVLPGSFARVLAMAEADQKAVIDSSKFKARSDSSYRLVCLVSGVAALVLLLGATIYLAVNGHKEAALGVCGLGAVGIISAFVNARFSKDGD